MGSFTKLVDSESFYACSFRSVQGFTVSLGEGGGTGTIRVRLRPTFPTSGPVRGEKLACRDVFQKREETDAALFRPGPGTYHSPLCAGEGPATCACHSSVGATLPQPAEEL